MKRKLLLSLIVIIALVAAWVVVAPDLGDAIPEFIMKAASDMRQVGIAAKLYADDHQGHLPQALVELVPAYLSDKRLLAHVQFTTPRAILAELPPESTILYRVAMDRRSHAARILVVHPDINVEWKMP